MIWHDIFHSLRILCNLEQAIPLFSQTLLMLTRPRLTLLLHILSCILTGKISTKHIILLLVSLHWSVFKFNTFTPSVRPHRGAAKPQRPHVSVRSVQRERGRSGEILQTNHLGAHGPDHTLPLALTWPAGLDPARPGWQAVAGRIYWNCVTFVAERPATVAQ